MRCLRSAAMLALLAAPLAAQSQRERLVVTPQWLNEHLSDRNLVVIHLGSKAGYDTAHIAGARLVDIGAIIGPTVAGGLSYELPNPDTLRAGLARMGVSDNSRIVLYPSTPAIQAATRVLLTFD